VLGQTAVQGRAAHPDQAQQLADVGSLVRREAQREPQRLVRAGWPSASLWPASGPLDIAGWTGGRAVGEIIHGANGAQ